MWIFTKLGFFSVVQVAGDPKHVQIRARTHGDLARLCKLGDPELSPEQIKATPDNDYPFRIIAHRSDWLNLLEALGDEVDYTNFKSEIARTMGREREGLYHEVWAVVQRGLARFRTAGVLPPKRAAKPRKLKGGAKTERVGP